MSNVNYVTFTIVLVLFLLVTLVGFAAARWRRADDMMHLNEWGLGGRSFGTFIAWFLLGGDLYTAYTFIAVPAAVFGAGAVTGFFAVSYTIIVFPIALIFLPRLWSIARTHNYITPADFIRGRYGSRGLSLATAFTGILALMPYIALQLVGIQAVLTVMGVGTSSTNTYVKDLPLFIAFLVLAIYTYVSGLRAPALIAFIKDTLVYVMIIVAVFYIPTRIGGWGHIFATAEAHMKAISPVTHKPNGVFIPTTGNSQLAFSTLALGSALALMVYPHSVTGVLSTKRRDIIKRNMALLPIYSLMLALRRAARLHGAGRQDDGRERQEGGRQRAARGAVPVPAHVPQLVRRGRLLGHRDRRAGPGRDHGHRRGQPVHPEHLQGVLQAGRQPAARDAGSPSGPRWWSSWARWRSRWNCRARSPSTCSCWAAIWILQVFPAIVFGLFTRWFHRWALLAGWLAGMVFGTIAAYKVATPTTSHWAGSVDIEFGHTIYIGLTAIILNIAVVGDPDVGV